MRFGSRGIVGSGRTDLGVGGALALLPLAFFPRETLGLATLGDQDAHFWFYPAYRLVAAQLASLELPLWNPFLYCGEPLLAGWQAGVLDPLNWIFLAAGVTPRVFTFVEQLSFSLSLISTYAYTRSLGLRPRASALAAVIYACSGYPVARTIYPGLLRVVALTPLVLCFVELICREASGRRARLLVAGGALVLAWQVCAAHPQPFLYSALLASAYALFRGCGSAAPRRAFARCAVMFAGGAGLSAVQWLSAFEVARESVRGAWSYDLFTLFSLHPVTLAGALIPFFHGGGRGIYRLEFWGPYWHHNEAGIYLGALALALAAAGTRRSRRWHPGLFWSVAIPLSAAAALGRYLPPFAYLLYQIPVLNHFRSPNRHWMEVTLGVAVLAAWAIDRRLEEKESEASRAIARTALIAGAALAALVSIIAWFALRSRDAAKALIGALVGGDLASGFLATAGAEFYLPVLAAAVALLALSVFARWRRAGYWLILVCLIADFGCYAYFAPISSTEPIAKRIGSGLPAALASPPDALNPWRAHVDVDKSSGGFSPLLFDGHEMATGYDPLMSARYKTFSGINEAGFGYLASIFLARDRTLDLLNVRYVLAGPATDLSDDSRWREVATAEGGGRIYENLRRMPRAWVVARVEPASDGDQLRIIRGEAGDFNPHATALIDPADATKVAPALFGGSDEGGRAQIIARSANRVRILTETAGPALLVLSEIYDPGWRARVDGAGREILRVNGVLRGVEVEAGRHDLEVYYAPAGLIAGALVSLATLVAMVMFCLRR